jgi:two-component system response regulator FlrC
MNDSITILIVEDDHGLREALCDTATLAGHNVLCADHGVAALEILGSESVDLVISDIQMPLMDGHRLLKEIRKHNADLPVVLITAYGSVQSAVEALRDGVTDYLEKPFQSEVLISQMDQWTASLKSAEGGQLIAEDVATKRVIELAKRVATSDAAVTITGESGVGKEIFFRLIHDLSPRSKKIPVAINCAAIPENMLEAVLFGYEKGSFTGAYKSSPGKFEQAQGSTLLLDEISEMSLALQAKLLRVLQERQVERIGSQQIIDLDVRVIATCNRDLKLEVHEQRFREDLYYRLNVFPLHVPPLRARRADIVPLARHMLERVAAKDQNPAPSLSSDACEWLVAYDWPGNVRELDNLMQRAYIVHRGSSIDVEDLHFERLEPFFEDPEDIVNGFGGEETLGNDLKDHERRLILSALEAGNGSRKYASDKLGISPRTLRYKIARMREDGITIPGN